jgi:hypothetical protein
MSETTERLDAIQARMDAAVKEPWHLAGGNEWISPIGICIAPDDGGVSVPEGDFIAAAPSDVAFLLDLARKQQAQLAEAWSEGAHFGGLYPVVFQNDNPYRVLESKP